MLDSKIDMAADYVAYLENKIEVLEECLCGMVANYCTTSDAKLDSMASATNSQAMKELAARGFIVIDERLSDNHLIGHWKKEG